MADEPIVLRCGHCGNTTAFYEKAKYQYNDYGDYGSDGVLAGIIWRVEWRILQCSVCDMLTLFQTATGFDRPGHDVIDDDGGRVLYPEEKDVSTNVPKDVATAYRDALQVAQIAPSAFAVMIGRTLEIICQREGAVGRDFQHRLSNLAESGLIPETLGRMAQQLRQIRNLGAHVDSTGDEVKKSDVPVILDFMDAILEYLYVAPAKIAALESRLNRKGR